MKIKYLFIYILLVSCANNKIEKSNDPIEKSESILKGISNQEYELVRNQFVGRKETIEKYKGTLDALSMEIFGAIKKYGLPNKKQIKIIGKEKLGIPKDYGDEFNGDFVDITSTKIILGQKKEFEIEMGFIMKNDEARLLRISADDKTKDPHLK